jgi:hypothetical protein
MNGGSRVDGAGRGGRRKGSHGVRNSVADWSQF